MRDDWVGVAKIGRAFGVKGEVFLHILSDFPESIKKGNTYFSRFGDLTIKSYSCATSLAKFAEIHSREETKKIINLTLYTTKEITKAQCKLKAGELFWFDVIGSVIIEEGEILGKVSAIDRFCGNDYLFVATSEDLVKKNFPKSFLIPYMERYIVDVEHKQDSKVIHTQLCKEILENS